MTNKTAKEILKSFLKETKDIDLRIALAHAIADMEYMSVTFPLQDISGAWTIDTMARPSPSPLQESIAGLLKDMFAVGIDPKQPLPTVDVQSQAPTEKQKTVAIMSACLAELNPKAPHWEIENRQNIVQQMDFLYDYVIANVK